MALKGTLKDFGIADIFQLISQQSKTGVLHVANKQEEVRISFIHGDVIRAESTSRKKRDLLGSLLVRAKVLTEEQLKEALEIQKLTLRRLGDILIERGMLTLEEIREFARLQTTETIYKLFTWESGTYAFEAEEVLYDKDTLEPLQSENVLMEGFRMVDEWPMIRKKIISYEMNFMKVQELPSAGVPGTNDEQIESVLDDMFSESGTKRKGPKDIGVAERKVFDLIKPDRNVQKYIDLSRLGEFETCKALLNLLLSGFIKIDMPARDAASSLREDDTPGGRTRGFYFGKMVVQMCIYLFIAVLLFLVFSTINVDIFTLLAGSGSTNRTIQEPIAKELLDQGQMVRLRAALEVYYLEVGAYPQKLEELVVAGLVSEEELRFPWRKDRYYNDLGDGYQLLRPFE